jgi:dihydrofolate reductase
MANKLKISMILLQSLDGFIAKNQQDKLDWGSKTDKQNFKEKTIEIGTMICGTNTYVHMPDFAFKNRKTYVLTSRPDELIQRENVTLFTGSPIQLVQKILDDGITKVALVGGGHIYNSFLAENLVDEIFITIAPVAFGKGIHGFGENVLANKFKLISMSKMGEDEIYLHYEVIE